MSYYGVPNAGLGGLVGGAYTGSTTGIGNYSYPIQTSATPTMIIGAQQGQQPIYGHPMMLPAPTGQKIPITFMDAHGHAWLMDVDAAYAPILLTISQQHQCNAIINATNSTTRKVIGENVYKRQMLEGDFSEDEMSQAEQIIQEMGNGSQKQPCQCEA